MTLSKEQKKEMLEENKNVLIWPFLKNPTPEDGIDPSDTIDAIVTHYMMQLSAIFYRYGFDVEDDSYNLGMNVAYNVIAATLYKTRNVEHDFAEDLEHMIESINEMNNRGTDKVISVVEDDDDEDDGPRIA